MSPRKCGPMNYVNFIYYRFAPHHKLLRIESLFYSLSSEYFNLTENIIKAKRLKDLLDTYSYLKYFLLYYTTYHSKSLGRVYHVEWMLENCTEVDNHTVNDRVYEWFLFMRNLNIIMVKRLTTW